MAGPKAQRAASDQRRTLYKPRKRFQKRGWLIAGEGIDGSGKTTIMQALLARLQAQGQAGVISNWNEVTEIYNLTMQLNTSGDLTPEMRLLLGAAELAARYHYVIRPALEAGQVVIANKYLVSVMAHWLVRSADRAFAERVYTFALKPDFTFYFDVPPQVALERKLESGGIGFWETGLDLVLDVPLEEALRRYESEEVGAEALRELFLTFQGRLRALHLQELSRYARVVYIDGTRPVDDVLQEALAAAQQLGAGTPG